MSADLLSGLPPEWGMIGAISAACVYAIVKAFADKKSPDAQRAVSQESTLGQTPAIPLWAMMGPVHDAIGAVHDMAEEHRKTNTMLVDMCKVQRDIDTGQKHTHLVLEAILRELELRGNYREAPVLPDVSQHKRRQP